jgi:hypothetical protein
MDWERVRQRFLRDPLPVRLAGLAADLSRVSSLVRNAPEEESVVLMMEESQRLIEWTAAEAEPEIAAELVDIQVMLALWRSAWPEARQKVSQRVLLSVQAKQWADRVLAYSGLLAS